MEKKSKSKDNRAHSKPNRILVFSGVMNLGTVAQHFEIRASVNLNIIEIMRKEENVTIYDW